MLSYSKVGGAATSAIHATILAEGMGVRLTNILSNVAQGSTLHTNVINAMVTALKAGINW